MHVAFPRDIYRVTTVDKLLDTWNNFLHTIVYGKMVLTPIDMLIEKCLPNASLYSCDSESDLALGIMPEMCRFNSKKDDEPAITVPPSNVVLVN